MPNRLREARGSLTLEGVAESLKTSPTSVSRWELRRVDVPDHRKIDLARLYGWRVTQLFDYGDVA